MTDLLVITPSRDRPGQLSELAWAVARTTEGRVEVLALVDDDDPQREAYERLVDVDHTVLSNLRILFGPRQTLSGWTNTAAELALQSPNPPRFLASLGDDHRPRSRDWDHRLIGAIEDLGGPGFAYGDDLFQGRALPTAWVVSASVVRALGWMMLPRCQHLYVDNAILDLGEASGRIAYRADVKIEHLHPWAGKASWDISYRESNSVARDTADKAAFLAWRAERMMADAATVAALTGRQRRARSG